ncbi:MAG: nitroreductase [Epulopiscium sp.]|nr:nitroreductase [Candidatus Epulonipiscium sp.]
MSLESIVKQRYSVRKFKDKEVEKDKISQILELVRMAPSAVNLQPWHFMVIRDKELKDRIANTYNRDWLKKAPVIIVACGNHDESWKRRDGKDHCDIDLAIAVDHLTLAAAEQGLGTCWVCNFDSKECAQILELADNLEAIALIPLGYPLSDEIKETPRKAFDEIVSWR